MTLSELFTRTHLTKRSLVPVIICSVLAVLWFITPEVTLAVTLLPGCADAGDCTLCDVVGVFINFASLMTELLGLLAVLMFIIGGVFIILAGGNAERAKRGRQILAGTLIGSLIVVSSWLIINFALAALLNADFDDVELFPGSSAGSGEAWYELSCVPVYEDCSTAANGSSCSESGCANNCVCYNGGCTSICAYKQHTAVYSNTHCESGISDCDATTEQPVGNWCPLSSTGEGQVCCIPR